MKFYKNLNKTLGVLERWRLSLSKKRKEIEITDETWTRWSSIKNFFEDITGEKTFKKQEDLFQMVEDINNPEHIVLCAGRGCGKTWSLAVIALWYAFVLSHLENRPIAVAVLAGSKDESMRLFNYLRRILKGHKEIDQYIAQNQKGGLKFTRDYIEFKNGSSIEALPCSMTGVCGPRANLLIIDEAGLEDFKEDVKNEAFEIITGQKYGRIIMASTPYYYRSPFVATFLSKSGWRKIQWSQEDCPWIKREEIERKRKEYSEVEFKIRVQGMPTPTEGKMFDQMKLKKVLFDPSEIHYAEYAKRIAGIDPGQSQASTALVIVEYNEVDKKFRVVHSYSWKEPDYTKIIPSIVQILISNLVSVVVVDSNPPPFTAMLKAATSNLNIEIKTRTFTHGGGDAMYHNLKRIIEREMIEIPHLYTGKMNTLVEQLRDMEWESKDPGRKQQTDLVDALALACSEEGGFQVYVSEEARKTMKEQFDAWRKEMEESGVITVIPEEEVIEENEVPPELRGNPNDKIFWYDPDFGDLRIMTKAEAISLWKTGGRKRLRTVRGEFL